MPVRPLRPVHACLAAWPPTRRSSSAGRSSRWRTTSSTSSAASRTRTGTRAGTCARAGAGRVGPTTPPRTASRAPTPTRTCSRPTSSTRSTSRGRPRTRPTSRTPATTAPRRRTTRSGTASTPNASAPSVTRSGPGRHGRPGVEPYTEPPDPDGKRQGFLQWQAAGAPGYQLVVEGGTHDEWSLLPTFPTTAWEPGGDGGWGNPLARHYTAAWLDRWLKESGEAGFEDADARLLADDELGPDGEATWRDRLSFYYRSSRDFPDRLGDVHVCEDIRLGCAPAAAPAPGDDAPAPAPEPAPAPSPGLPATGGGAVLVAGVLLLAARGLRARG